MRRDDVVCLSDLEKLATARLPRNARDYYTTGSCAEITQKSNLSSYNEFLIRPRVLRPTHCLRLSTTLLGHKVSMPLCVAPVALQAMAHPSGELATAAAAVSSDTLFCMSTVSNAAMRDVASANGRGVRWFQVYVLGLANREQLIERVRLAETLGFSALVLTVDLPVGGMRYECERNAFVIPTHLALAFPEQIKAIYSGDHGSVSLDWELVDWLVSITTLPVVLKGICTSEDALLAIEHGASAVWVSNHGGRHLDRIPGPLELLTEVVRGLAQAGAGHIEVYLDGGIRHGTDVIKALSLGARAVFIGQPVIWGLAYHGQEGVSMVLELLREELRLALALAGCRDVKELPEGLVVRKSEYLNSKL